MLNWANVVVPCESPSIHVPKCGPLLGKMTHLLAAMAAATIPMTETSTIPLDAKTPIKESILCRVRARIPTHLPGDFYLHLYEPSPASSLPHLAIVYGNQFQSHSLNTQWHSGESHEERIIRGASATILPPQQHKDPILVRIHSECFTGETLCSSRCDCGQQLESSMQQLVSSNGGIIVYLRQEGRGIGLEDKLKYTLLLAHHSLDHTIFKNKDSIL